MPKPKKKNKDRVNDKQTDFVFILYPDNADSKLLLLEIKAFHYDALAVLHDKDTYTKDKIDEETGEVLEREGDYKKPHYHVYIRFPSRRYISGVSKEIGVPEHLIQFADNYKAYAEYMLHWGKWGGAGKYIYDTTDFIGSLAGDATNKLVKEPPDLKVNKIIRFIDMFDGFVDIKDVYDWCYPLGYSGILNSRMRLIESYIVSHNQRYAKRNHR